MFFGVFAPTVTEGYWQTAVVSRTVVDTFRQTIQKRRGRRQNLATSSFLFGIDFIREMNAMIDPDSK